MESTIETFEINQGNTYVTHNFDAKFPDMDISGLAVTTGLPALHGYQVTLTVHGGSINLPPPGVFNWHYLQCVLKRFATPDYRSFNNIVHYEMPFKTSSDSDIDEFEDDGSAEPPYPSYRFDRYLQEQAERLRLFERNEAISGWVSDGLTTHLFYKHLRLILPRSNSSIALLIL